MEQFTQTVREFVATLHDAGDVGTVEVVIRRADGGTLDVIDVEVTPPTSRPSTA